MTLFKNILSATALIAVLSFSSLSMSAQRVSEVKDRTPNKEYLLGEMDMSKTVTSQSYRFIYNKATVDRLVKYINSCTPYTLNVNSVLTSVDMDMDNNVINFNTTCDYATCVTLEALDDYSLEELNHLLAAFLYELFNAAGPDDNGDTLIKCLQDMEIEVNYIFYVKGISVPVKTVTISAESIEHAGLIANKIFSI